MILERPVWPRARRMADIVASVPLLVMRTFLTAGTQARMSSAISTSSGLGVPKLVPFSKAAAMAARIEGSLWPWMAGPQVKTKSISSLPSAVVRRALSALTVKKGVPPTERKARTGEFTPPGIIFWARAKRSSEAEAMDRKRAIPCPTARQATRQRSRANRERAMREAVC